MTTQVRKLLYVKLFAIIGLVLLGDIVLFNHISFAWIFPLLAFVYLPGRLLLAALVPRGLSRLAAILYGFGLGLVLLMATGLAINAIGQILSQGSGVLTTGNVLWTVHIELALLGSIAFWRHMKATDIFTLPASFPWPRPFDVLTIFLSAVVILVSIGSVNLLNNGGSSGLAEVAIGLCALLPLYVVLLRKRITLWSYASALFGISLALLFMSSLRSHYLVGSDVLNEFHVAQVVANQKFWSISQIASTYNACVSITVLPQLLHLVTGQDGLWLFRAGFQVLFSVSPIILFCIARPYLKPVGGFLASLSFVVFSNYISSMPNHVRQEVALLFFMLVVMAMLSRELPRRIQKLFVLLFAFAMVVSHYSTAYIGVLIFGVSTIAHYCLHWLYSRQRKKPREQTTIVPEISVMGIRMVATILLFTVFWYSQIIQSSGGPIAYIKQVSGQILSGSADNKQADQTSLKDQFNLFHKARSNQESFTSYVKAEAVAIPGYQPRLLATPISPPQLRPLFLNNLLKFAGELVKKLYKFLAIAGTVVLLWYALRQRSPYGMVYSELLAGCFAVIGLSFVLPSFTVNYDQERMFQQLLVLLAIPIIFLAMRLLQRFNKTIVYSLLAIFLGFYILTSTSFMSQVTGGTMALQQNNQGTDYNRYYVHTSEIAAGTWMKHAHRYQPIYTDDYAQNRLNFINSGLFVQGTLLPGKFRPGAFVYYDYGNTVGGVTYQSYQGGLLVFTTPTGYLNANFNQLYNNGGSTVYGQP